MNSIIHPSEWLILPLPVNTRTIVINVLYFQIIKYNTMLEGYKYTLQSFFGSAIAVSKLILILMNVWFLRYILWQLS